MSVIIENMEMPKNCGTCRLNCECEALPYDEWEDLESIVFNDVIGINGVRQENCPLKEQKVGKWVKVHGYATPGGDPVWMCSNCGKGIHVYGIEHTTYGSEISDGQWVTCPNCGAKMVE